MDVQSRKSGETKSWSQCGSLVASQLKVFQASDFISKNVDKSQSQCGAFSCGHEFDSCQHSPHFFWYLHVCGGFVAVVPRVQQAQNAYIYISNSASLFKLDLSDITYDTIMLFNGCFDCEYNPKLKASFFWLVVTKTSTICERKLCVIAYAGDSLT